VLPLVRLRRISILTSVGAGIACASPRARPITTVPARDCSLGPGPVVPIDSATILLTATVDPNRVPRPTSWAERFVFALTYDTARVDCGGRSLGSAPYRIADARRGTLLLQPISTGPRLAIRTASEADARDLIDAGVDLLLTDRPALISYAATRGDAVSVPLPWDRTWVVATALPGGLGLDPSTDSVRAGLARDVVRTDARVSVGPYWWADVGSCGPLPTSPAAATTPASTRVVYSRDEPIARALAERLVALIGAGAVSSGLTPNAFASALSAGTDLAYVLPLERTVVDRCVAVRDLIGGAPWMARVASPVATMAPLIDTRLAAVIRRNRLHLAFTKDSTVTIAPGRP